jgi:XTP/dITP diphosphohydrolase
MGSNSMWDSQMKTLLLATTNKSKLSELRGLLAQAPVHLQDLSAFSNIAKAEETALTFLDNAVNKARYYAGYAEAWTLADDSGLEVDCLDGRPGVFSARYAGPGASDAEKISKLLAEMESKGLVARDARFTCAVALSDPNANIVFSCLQFCPGRIADKPSGSNGFGYDPVFIPQGYEQTFAELPSEIKHVFSHRARALKMFSSFLFDFLDLQA